MDVARARGRVQNPDAIASDRRDGGRGARLRKKGSYSRYKYASPHALPRTRTASAWAVYPERKKAATLCGTRAARDFRIGYERYEEARQPDRNGRAHEREVTDVYAAGFPSISSSGDGGGAARHGAHAGGRRAGRQRSAPRRTDPGLFPRLESSGLSLVRAARIGSWPDNELVALAGAAAPK